MTPALGAMVSSLAALATRGCICQGIWGQRAQANAGLQRNHNELAAAELKKNGKFKLGILNMELMMEPDSFHVVGGNVGSEDAGHYAGAVPRHWWCVCCHLIV